jgi:hypothetical protein
MPADLKTRESYLNAALDAMRPWFPETHPVPEKVRVSVGFPKGRAKGEVVGQCWADGLSEDKHFEIFLTPTRGSDETEEVLLTLLHEMVHAAVGVECQHKGAFITVARGLGFVPKWTSSANHGEELAARVAELAESLGPIPHGALTPSATKATQKTYMLLISHEPCGFKIRASKKQVEAAAPDIVCWVCGEVADVAFPEAGA